jgi:type IV pilus assembly protein PilZ
VTIDRRAHARVSASILVRYATPDGSFDEYLTRDISKGGLFIRTDKAHDLGEQFEIFLCLPDGTQEIVVLGQVVRMVGFEREFADVPGPKGIGIRFVIVEPKQEQELDTFIDTLLELEGSGSRQHPRIQTSMRAAASCPNGVQPVTIGNISKGGMFLLVDEDCHLQVRQQVDIDLQLPPDNSPLRLPARVVHKREFLNEQEDKVIRGVGIKFVDLTDEQMKAVNDLIRSLVKNGGR